MTNTLNHVCRTPAHSRVALPHKFNTPTEKSVLKACTWKVSIKCTCHYQVLGTCILPQLVGKVLHRKCASWPHSENENSTRECSWNSLFSYFLFHSFHYFLALFHTFVRVCPWQVHRIRTFICSVLHNLSKPWAHVCNNFFFNKNLPLTLSLTLCCIWQLKKSSQSCWKSTWWMMYATC